MFKAPIGYHFRDIDNRKITYLVDRNTITPSKETSSHGDAISGERISVSSGDDASSKHGLWMKGVYSKTFSGLDSHRAGGMIGYDFSPKDNVTLGLSAMLLGGRIKQKDGERLNTNSKMATIYGFFAPGNWIWENYLSLGRTDIKSVDVGDKYRVSRLGARSVIGYKYNLSNTCRLIPSIGARYGHTTMKKQNSEDEKTSSDRIFALLGLKLQRDFKISEDHKITPDLYTGFDISVVKNSKAPEEQLKKIKSSAFRFKAGAKLSGQKGKFEYCLDSEYKKYRSYSQVTGSLKLHVNL